jgi:hypothetical protein
MKNILLIILLSFFVSSATFAFSSVPVLIDETESVTNTVKKKKKTSSFKTFRKETEKKLGRKLGLFERIGLWYYSKLAPDPEADARKANSHALIGFILSLCGLIIFPLLLIPGFILSNSALRKEKMSPGILDGANKGLAKAGFIISIVAAALIVLLLLYVLVVIGLYGFGGL